MKCVINIFDEDEIMEIMFDLDKEIFDKIQKKCFNESKSSNELIKEMVEFYF